MEEPEIPEWTKRKSIIVLLLATITVAFVSEQLVDTFEMLGEKFGWTELFIGVIIVAIVGNAAEHVSAITMAVKDKMDVAVEIAVGSTLQVAMFVAPILVLILTYHAAANVTCFHNTRVSRNGIRNVLGHYAMQ